MVMAGGAVEQVQYAGGRVPNSTTADTCEAIDVGIGPDRPSGSAKPCGTASAVV